MFKLLALLLILVILFGVEVTRALVFGTFSIIALVILGILGLCLLIYILNALGSERPQEPEKTKPKAEPKKLFGVLETKEPDSHTKSDPKTLKALAVVGLFFIIAIVVALLITKNNPS